MHASGFPSLRRLGLLAAVLLVAPGPLAQAADRHDDGDRQQGQSHAGQPARVSPGQAGSGGNSP